ncbi:helix-turn-helix domain-containing protein [Actinomadura darangshiensis]|uniref:Helix-turn-helix domain-containing protein n=1 Tax=Actinomadura darangshiensis TaxID=705336 RepID=A0A4R5AW56_9ACTN|nr:helix-turn-helix domain-containing protein [Actinomadura darangshiensis]TDD75394.1 helix-turn-helix domain-containing protein [Actinomadura darangshiensis]
MIRTVFSTAEIPPERRLAAFDRFQAAGSHAMRVLSDEPRDFQATARALDLELADVVELTCSSAEVRRTPQLIRAHDPGLYSVVFPLRGGIVVAQSGRQAVLGHRDLALYESRYPLRVRITAENGAATLVRAQVPRALVPWPSPQIDRILATTLSGTSGVGALLVDFLVRVTAEFGAYRQADLPRLGRVAVDLLNGVIAHHLQAGPWDDAHPYGLLPRIQDHVRRHLHDPRLSPRSIAAAHHISVSHLHRLFQSHDMPVTAWIRRLRLEHARLDLGDPALRPLPVHRIAALWGFKDHATFTRAFRAAYGIAPSDYRHRVRTSAPSPAAGASRGRTT